MGKTPEEDIRDLAKNYIRNAGLDFWQRFGPVKTFTSNNYIQDRWFSGSTGPVLFERLSTSPPVEGNDNYTRISYSASGTDNTNDFYYFEDIDLVELKGKRVTFSILVRRGGALNDGFSLRVFKSPNANNIAGPWTQIAQTIFADAQIPEWTDSPSDWAIMPVSFDIPDDGSANGLRLNYVNTVNPAASTFIEIAQPMLNIGGARRRWNYFGGSYEADLKATRRYYLKSYDLDIAPGTVDFSGNIGLHRSLDTGNTGRIHLPWDFPTEMRVIPAAAVYSPDTGTLGEMWGASGDITAAVQVDRKRVSIYNVDGTVAGDFYRAHAAMEAEF